MSDPTKPCDPWEVTDNDAVLATNKYWGCEPDSLVNTVAAMSMADALREDRKRLRARIGASPKPATEPTWIKIGDHAVKTESIHEVWRNGGTWLMRQSGMCSTPLTGPEGNALWAYFTDPVRCVDLTPVAEPTTPNP